MIENYVDRKLLEIEKYYEFGRYFPYLESYHNLYDLILKGEERIVLLGDAGYGKSTELKMIAYRFIKERNQNFIPIFIELNTYTDESIEDYVINKIGEESESLLDFNKSKLVFLFDEFDQVIDKVTAVRKIKNFIEKYNESTFIIACRTNFYSNQFENFNIFILLPFSLDDIKNYAQKLLNNNSEILLDQLKEYSLFDIAKNPFFLKNFIEIYKVDQKIPGNRAKIFSKMVSISLKNDENRLADKYDLRQRYPTSAIEKDLMYLSLVMETLQRNFILIEELEKIIKDREKRDIISELSLIKKSFFKNGDVYQFQHNNFQEYLASKKLANLSLNVILKFISMSINGINKINPSWVNTVAFMCQLREKDDLLKYLIKNEPKLVLKFEKSRIDENKREKLFKNIFEKYTHRKILIDREIDYEIFANFANTKRIYSYLMKYAKSNEHYIYRYNSIQMLGRMRGFKDESLNNLLIQYAKDEDENKYVRHICLYALSWLEFDTQDTIEALKHLKDSNDDWILSGLYYLIKESEYTDQYVDILLSVIGPSRRFTLFDVGLNIAKGIEKIQSVEGIRKIVKYFINNSRDLEEFHIEKSLKKIVKNMIKVYNIDNTIFYDIKDLLKIVDKKYMDKVTSKILIFFKETKTNFKLFKEIYNAGDIKNNYRILASIADKECTVFFVDEYLEGRITDKDVWSFIINLPYKSKNNLLKIINEKTNNFYPQPLPDYEKEKKDRKKRELEIIFSREGFLKEVAKIFNGEGKKDLSFADMDNILFSPFSDIKYNDFVVRELRSHFGLNKSKKWQLDELKEEIKNMNYELFTVRHVFNLLHDGSEIELSEEQEAIIKNFCFKNLKNVNFKEALKPKIDGVRAVGPLAIFLWYFLRKFDLEYPENVLLDMLSFDWVEGIQFVGIDYLERKLPHEKIKNRILENIDKGIEINQIIKNHISYCKKYNIFESKEWLYEIVENPEIEIDNRLLALETVADFPNSMPFLIKNLDINESKLFSKAAKVLISKDYERFKKELIKKLSSHDKNIALESAKLLIEKQNLEGIKFYADYIKRTKIFEDDIHNRNPIQKINTIEAIPILLDLLKFSYKYGEIIKQDKYHTLNRAIIKILKFIAIKNYSNFTKVKKQLKEFIEKYQSKYEGINALYTDYDDIERTFFINFYRKISVDEAINKVKIIIN